MGNWDRKVNKDVDCTVDTLDRTHFLKGVVTGNERLRFGFMTKGFRRICGPSDDRLGSEVIGGGAEDGGAICGGGETGIGGMGAAWVGIGDWYMSCWGGTCGMDWRGLARQKALETWERPSQRMCPASDWGWPLSLN